MGADSFWDNRTAAQKIVDEASAIKKKLEPLNLYAKQLEDLEVLL